MIPWGDIFEAIKVLGIGAFVVWIAKTIHQNGKLQEQKRRKDDENKMLKVHQETQAKNIRRSEEAGKNASLYAKKLEGVLFKVDPNTLDAVKLDNFSENPLDYSTDFTEAVTRHSDEDDNE